VQNQQVLVTGGAGFIGSELVRQLAGPGFGVRVVDNLVNGKRENLGKEIKINVLATMVAEVVGRSGAEVAHAERRPGDVVRLLSDSSRARKLLGFKTTVELRDGLVRLRDWYESQGKSPEELLEQEIERNWEIQHVPTHV
jgi:UDP-glucose 4-epimerase